MMLYDHPLERAKQYLTHNVVLPCVYRQADRIVPLGPNLADDLVAAGFPEEKVRAMYQPFDARTFAPVSKDECRGLKRKLGLDPTKKVILFVGRIEWEKGADRLQSIIEKILSRSNRFQFCLVGEGPSRSQFAKYDEGVLLPGFVPHEDVHDYFQAADLLVHPSRSEGLPHVVLEALACKTPVMASPVGEIDTVLSVTSEEPEDYVEYILADNWTVDPLPDQLGWKEQARAYAELLQGAATGQL